MTRIETLSRLTRGINTLLDIGTDHGFVIIDAIQNGFIQRAIACDINPMPLDNARQNIEAKQLTDLVDFQLTNGFIGIHQPFDGVLIAGMGMHLIKDILNQTHPSAKRYILQANNHVDQLRQYLAQHHYRIIDEATVYEKFHYVILVCEKGEMTLDAKDIFVGPILKSKKYALPFYKHQLAIWVRNYDKATGQKQAKLALEIAYLREIIESLELI
jgi:tRNA (adenine22-N1)-methyltransferase